MGSETMKVSVVGLGTMGTALAKALLQKNFETFVWNRTHSKAEALSENGARAVSEIAEAIRQSDVIVICVLNYEVVKEILFPFKSELQGKAIINLTNGTPAQATAVSEFATEAGAEYLDGGIMAIPPMIGMPEAFILYSGYGKAFEKTQAVTAAFGTAQFMGTNAGTASLIDLALLSAMYGMFGGYFHSVALAKSGSISAADFIPMVTNWLHAMITALPHFAAQIDAKDYKLGGVVSNLAMNVVSFENILEASKTQGLKTDLMQPIKNLLLQANNKGFGDDDISALVEVIKN
ncbi:NAD(P)-dependent oxidoreductase [Niastella sp. OAS944]|uniref:NAD(P)-dependent oxidoreductase n=1 Tax=Niastella sp. OAS944 TaxID=2664089 RepID=UPI00348D60DD|nr:3-hydroxyisobutyrate dehydrogenase-like beta-hydroxyacid dehydrogenase [Chitinophagaceae bacterium OAS944]